MGEYKFVEQLTYLITADNADDAWRLFEEEDNDRWLVDTDLAYVGEGSVTQKERDEFNEGVDPTEFIDQDEDATMAQDCAHCTCFWDGYGCCACDEDEDWSG